MGNQNMTGENIDENSSKTNQNQNEAKNDPNIESSNLSEELKKQFMREKRLKMLEKANNVSIK